MNTLEIVRCLGRGAMGEVFLARDPRSADPFVIKRLSPGRPDAFDLPRFRREAEVMRRLRHPNIMPVLHVDATAHPPFFVMPFREGRTLEAHLARGPLDSRLVAQVGRDVSFGLAEAHRFGIVHRDVKPSNVFLEANGRSVILDFGLAKTLAKISEDFTATGVIVGTPDYMSPEQCRGERATEKSDIYSLGVTMLELLLGMNPFASDDILVTLARHIELVPAELAAAPDGTVPGLWEVIRRMVDKDPGRRPSAESSVEALARVARQHAR